jgi:hypothetical protein
MDHYVIDPNCYATWDDQDLDKIRNKRKEYQSLINILENSIENKFIKKGITKTHKSM